MTGSSGRSRTSPADAKTMSSPRLAIRYAQPSATRTASTFAAGSRVGAVSRDGAGAWSLELEDTRYASFKPSVLRTLSCRLPCARSRPGRGGERTEHDHGCELDNYRTRVTSLPGRLQSDRSIPGQLETCQTHRPFDAGLQSAVSRACNMGTRISWWPVIGSAVPVAWVGRRSTFSVGR